MCRNVCFLNKLNFFTFTGGRYVISDDSEYIICEVEEFHLVMRQIMVLNRVMSANPSIGAVGEVIKCRFTIGEAITLTTDSSALGGGGATWRAQGLR